MKYLEQYIEEKLKIKVLGKLTTRECCEGDGLGVSLVIDGFEPGIEVWYVDYSKWLERKLDELLEKKVLEEEEQIEEEEEIMFTFEEFRDEVLTAMENKPNNWRDGQFVFNYIDEKYGVARSVQFIDGVDCFYVDSKIEDFITRSYEYIKNADYKKI
jgi:hypothetical protein